jgi:type II secretory ATPase GspE/PulE/Tfp pilus assembly ATPase PilB-like protein
VQLAPGLSPEFLAHHRVCPVGYEDQRPADAAAPERVLVVAVEPESCVAALDDLSIAYGCEIAPHTVDAPELDRLLDQIEWRSRDSLAEVGISLGDESPEAATDDDTTLADARDLASQPPVIRYVNLMIREACVAGASDIHLETTREGRLVVRFRADGVLANAMEQIPQRLADAVVSRLKLLAQLDIAERRRPQDGRIRVRLESRELDLRLSTVPTLHGESVVLRLLDRSGRPAELEGLGMSPALLADVAGLCGRAHGMIVVTGPTGSGKTTTQYAMLLRRQLGIEKIITVEDPVEYELPGVAQVPVHRQAGVTMASALRSILRQDPDVIMVGEMRDAETAEVAIQAAMTGHLVFSTLHTTDAVGAVPRLLDLGIPDYLIAATLGGVLAQRLVRKICDHCRAEYTPDREQLAAIGRGGSTAVPFARGTGCEACGGTGYRGRVGLFELLSVTETISTAIARRAERSDLAALALKQGMTPLRTDGWAKVEAGVTTVEELVRVTTD